jgi:ABC-2 type transport system ATP-binding protein
MLQGRLRGFSPNGSALSNGFSAGVDPNLSYRGTMPLPQEKKEWNMALLEADGLRKHFNDTLAVDEVAFAVDEGSIFGFLGPNGAGKTTTINMLTGLARPTAGRIFYQGQDYTHRLKQAQHLMGVVPDESNLYPELNGFDNLCFCAALYGLGKAEREARARSLLGSFGLKEAAGRKFGGYSKGMKRKLTIAAAIIHQPAILFLDEPTSGIDVASARQIRQLLAELKREGTTIFLTTHYIEEAERLCDRIAFIVNGRIVAIDDVSSLLKPIQNRYVTMFSAQGLEPPLISELKAAFPNLDFQPQPNDQLRVESAGALPIGPIVRFFEERRLEVTEARRANPSLEDVFVRITGIEALAMKKEKEKPGGAA